LLQGQIFINAGIGFGNPLFGDTAIPPISASFDYMVPINKLPFSFGAYVGFTTSKHTAYGGDLRPYYNYKWDWVYKYTGLAFGARAGYHFNFGVKNLDTYGGLMLGYYRFAGKAELEGSDTKPAGLDVPSASVTDYSTFLFGFNGGVRYFFTNNIGAYAEFGYSAISFISVGVSVKF
jgi:hypothetical protein